MREVLVATDLTVGSELALERMLGLCGDSCNITLLHVLRTGLPDPLRMQLHNVIEGYLADRAVYSRDGGSATIRAVVATGHPFTTIVSQAVARRAELIVVGEPALLRRPQLFVGSTAECVARLTDRPLLMVKRPGTEPYRTVAVALDGSPASVRALKTAALLAPEAGFRIIYAHAPAAASRAVVDYSLPDIKDRMRSELDAAFGDRSKDRPNITIEIADALPYPALRHASDAADLLVMGTHSKATWATGLEIGKLAHHMLAEAPCDVLVSPQ